MDGWIARQTDKYYPRSSFGRPLSRRKCVLAGHRGEQTEYREAPLFGEEGMGRIQESPAPPLRRGQEAVRTFLWVQTPCRDWYANTYVTYMHTPCPKGLSEAGIPCPVPGIFRVFAVWKRHSQEDECEEETNPPKQTHPPTAHGSQPGQGKGLTAATTPWEDAPGLMRRKFVQGNAHQRARSRSGLGWHCVARY